MLTFWNFVSVIDNYCGLFIVNSYYSRYLLNDALSEAAFLEHFISLKMKLKSIIKKETMQIVKTILDWSDNFEVLFFPSIKIHPVHL